MPLVSVIIPTFNRASFLRSAIDSVLNQTLKDLEVIVVDDGSEDETPEMVPSLTSDPRLIFHRERHGGVAAARNHGITLAQSPWIAFLDSDDYWLRQKLMVQWKFISDRPDVRICQTGDIWMRNGRRVNPQRKHQKYSGWIFESCMERCIVSASDVMIHREVFDACGKFDESLPACEDYDLWLRVSLKYPVELIDEQLVVKRGGHGDQLSKKYWGMDRFRVRALSKLLERTDLTNTQRGLILRSIGDRMRILERGAVKREKTLSEIFLEVGIPSGA